jgi:glycosyltransferase involved in cell wall biosynthesis
MPLTVSVVIATCNGERFLAQALDSVAAQTRPPTEILVVDDGSADGTRAVVAGYPDVRWLSQTNQGPGSARNAGVAASGGDLVALLDQDDLWEPAKLERQVAYLEGHAEVGFVGALRMEFLEPGDAPPVWVRHLGVEVPSCEPSALVVRRAVFDRVGPFDASYRFSSDVEWLVRARDMGIKDVVIPELLVRRRVHAGNDTHAAHAAAGEVRRILLSSIRRKRQQGRSPE